jgi:putative phage-type endonuclease
MKTTNYENEQDWLEARKCKITGSRLKDIITLRGTGKKIGFYELIAERLALPATEENPMDRGHRLEEEAIEKFESETKKVVDKSLVIWQRDDKENIAISPDGFIGDTEAVEVKCLASSRHIEAYLNNKVPNEYEYQVLQYFIVNDNLKKLYFVFYDPRLSVASFFYLEITRESLEQDIGNYLEYQKNVLEEVNEIVNKLTF